MLSLSNLLSGKLPMTESYDQHYKELPVEPFDLIVSLLSPEEWKGFLKGNMIKYAIRAGRKPGESIEKDFSKYEAYKKLLFELQ